MRPARADGAILAGTAAAAALVATAFWPGILTWDAIRQYGQALSGRYDDWHPPAMNWLWRQLRPVGDGPAPMMLLQALLYGGGWALFLSWAWRRGRPRFAAALTAVGATPIALVLVATVLKDSLMAGALLAAAGLAARRPWRRRPAALMAAALLIGAATLRFNAVPACLPLGVALVPARWRATPARLALATVAWAVPLVAALPAANALLRAERSGVELSLVVYDLGGITRFSGVDVFPPLPVADAVAVNARCYSPVSWDRYAWWGADPCPIGFATVRPALAAAHAGATRLWAAAVLRHPLAYARHRLAHFNRTTRFLAPDGEAPGLSLRSDPNPWGYRVRASRPGALLGAAAAWSLGTPLGWPCVWLALGLGALALAPALPRGSPAAPVLLSALLYGVSYLPLGVASEVRYHLWTMLGAGVGAAIAFAQADVGWRRKALALAPAVLVAGLAAAARIAG